ncbi:glycoside hydrolase family 2 TIM barrel-domain containing protein [Carboxylicivirga sp. M1479]|uniref:glycoside hydrolase family 2 protein n=1 Tax=Carboxylicivirga sp. M1479 TaxID=2594476 RepID=UPI001177E7A1|nr:glycoside hydrolase family 2 TIM barrel-domain containing protein [Carboxylicivirga sp. M1479]TRX60462.1 glycoside hydrolase family 2 protein [Carboxylicivirga sp. M1479]
MKQVIVLVLLFIASNLVAQNKILEPEYSVAGFFEVPNSGREVFDFNVGWHFYKGAIKGAEAVDFDDSNWDVVTTPHGLELNSTQASGNNHYQGEAWYRKHFTIPEGIGQKKMFIHFEAIMGKSKVWLNGELLAEHFGGYLPFGIDISSKVKKGEKNILSVWADNSDDPNYAPGKPNKRMDFNYFGGIYRDVWLVTTSNTYITNPNYVNKTAGGGLAVHYQNLSEKQVDVIVQADIANDESSINSVLVLYTLKSKDGRVLAKKLEKASIPASSSKQVKTTLKLKQPELWSPKNPYLHNLEVSILTKNKVILDGVKQKIGIRKIEFRGKDGFYLNNKAYEEKLIGSNRHQDYGYIGNALPNSGQWRDAIILKEAGCNVVRAAHYPADPAFMDACDELGLFFIEATPGWQFWNKTNPLFEQRIYEDIKNMVRRDRNRASVLMWEPVLNETRYSESFAKNAHDLVHTEVPGGNAFTVCDGHAIGNKYYDVLYSHPFKRGFYNRLVPNTPENNKADALNYDDEDRCFFTREWGDCVDDWGAQNSPSRCARRWGENAQMVQAIHYANPPYRYTSLEALANTPRQHIGGTLWHGFDHQRGGQPEPFYGGLTDVFRQTKYSYQLFKSQLKPNDDEPFIYIANEMTPFSPSDIPVFTNCEEVRLIKYQRDTLSIRPDREKFKMNSPIAIFKDEFYFADLKNLNRSGKKKFAYLEAQGLIDGEVVVSTKRVPSSRTKKVKLELAHKNISLVANGSDIITIIASVVDENGVVERLNNDVIKFEIEGEGKIIGDQTIMANPVKIHWGTAPLLIQSTTQSGEIKIKASVLEEGINNISRGEISFSSIPARVPLVFTDNPKVKQGLQDKEGNSAESSTVDELKNKVLLLEKELNEIKLKKVDKQQEVFEGGGEH